VAIAGHERLRDFLASISGWIPGRIRAASWGIAYSERQPSPVFLQPALARRLGNGTRSLCSLFCLLHPAFAGTESHRHAFVSAPDLRPPGISASGSLRARAPAGVEVANFGSPRVTNWRAAFPHHAARRKTRRAFLLPPRGRAPQPLRECLVSMSERIKGHGST
jgi:hypothetical protein